MPGGIVDAYAAQGADDDLVVLRQAQAGDLVVGEGVRIRIGMLEAGFLAGVQVHAVQPVHGPDPYLVAGALEGGRAVVLADEQVWEDFGLGEAFAFDGPYLIKMAAEGDPHGAVLLDVAGLGHQVVVRDVALQGIHQDALAVVREADAEKLVAGGEPDAALVVASHRLPSLQGSRPGSRAGHSRPRGIGGRCRRWWRRPSCWRRGGRSRRRSGRGRRRRCRSRRIPGCRSRYR